MAMSKKQNRQKPLPGKKPRDSVFKEAWENMSHDASRVMPDFLAKRLQSRKVKVWVMVIVTFIELVALGAVGKYLYDWFTG